MSKVRIYSCLLAYNSKEALWKWRQKTLSDSNVTFSRQEDNRITIRYNKDPYQYPDNDPCYVEWVLVDCGKMDVMQATAGCEFYDIRFLDGSFKADDIQFILSRFRMGQWWVDDETHDWTCHKERLGC